jgi:hypothetical protein
MPGRGGGVLRGVTLGPGLGRGGGVGPSGVGPWISTKIGEPVLKNPIVAVVVCGGWSASNPKLYNVPQRIAFAFGFWTKVSELQVTELGSEMTVHGALLYPASPTVPSCGHPGCCGGAWNPILLTLIGGSQRHAQGLDRAIEVLIKDGVFIVPDSIRLGL